MDRYIAPYESPGSQPPHTRVPGLMGRAPQPAAKTGRDYLRALRKRWWLVVAIGLLVLLPAMLFVARQPAIYQAQAEIELVPPQFDAALAVIIEHEATLQRENTEQFVLNKIAQIKSKSLIDEVVHEYEPSDPVAASELAAELASNLVTKKVPGTNLYVVTLDSHDQDRVEKLLNTWLKLFAQEADARGRETIENSIVKANESLLKLKGELTTIESDIARILKDVPTFAPGGRDRLEEEFLAQRTLLTQKQLRFEDLAYEQRISEIWPHLREANAAMQPGVSGQLAQLYQAKHDLDQQLGALRRSERRAAFNRDPYVKLLTEELARVCDGIEALEASAMPREAPNLHAMAVSRAGNEIVDMRADLAKLQAQIHATAPQFQKYLALLEQKDHINELIYDQADNLMKFRQVSDTLKQPVQILQHAVPPIAPVRPNRVLNAALAIVLAGIAALGVVFLMEAADRLVKDPEHVVAGLSLPLLTVVPRMRRLARTVRGGHLWTAGAPDSVEADAFRNLRASLVGIEGCDRPIISVLVTSAKIGDGKSTTALNLAAACARAGERTILVDCDLRRASLAGVFGADPSVGLVDVLSNDIPWQHAVVPCTETPNLSFLPSGHLGDIPIEILGSLELKQLLSALSRHYHRVILDAPAVLGLADGRILGSLSDVTIMVVRSETHELGPLLQAKSMLEQTRARVVGVVFNDMSEGLQNWSSHRVSYAAPALAPRGENKRQPLELEAPATVS